MAASPVQPTVAPPPAQERPRTVLDLEEDRGAGVVVQTGFLLVAAGMVGLALLLDLPVDSAWGPAISAIRRWPSPARCSMASLMPSASSLITDRML